MKSGEPARIGNFQRGFAARGAAFVLPALFSILALGGVTAPPALNMNHARTALELSEARVHQYETEMALHQSYESQQLMQGAQHVLARTRSMIPESCTNVVAHGVLRMAAANVGIELEQLQVALDKDLGVAALDKPVAALEVSVGGSARIAQITALVDELKRLGFPNCVFEVSLRRSGPAEREFEFRLDLGLLHYTNQQFVAVPTATEEQP